MSERPAGIGRAVRLYRGEQHIDFPRLWKRAWVVSLAAVVVSIGSFSVRGFDLGIEFDGGTAWEVRAPGVSVSEVRQALRTTRAADAKVQTVGGDTIRVRAGIDGDTDTTVDDVSVVLAELADVESDDVSVTTVGPSWGSQVTGKARNALLAFFALVAAYIAVRLEWRMSVGALTAVVHDILLCVGFYSIFGFEITPATIIAFLTIMGYSLYDTIVVYDKVRDVVGRVSSTGRYTYTEMMNLALNRVLMRSVNTSITSMLPVVSMLVVGSFALGAVTLQEFAIALLVGIVVGTYSSVFVAASLVAWMKEREPAYVAVAEKVRRRHGTADGARARTAATADAVLGSAPSSDRASGSRSASSATSSGLSPVSSSSESSSPESAASASPSDLTSGSEAGPALADRPVIPPRPRKRKRKKKKR